MSGIVPTINLKSFTEDVKTVLVENEGLNGGSSTFESVKTTVVEHNNITLMCPDHPNEGVRWTEGPDPQGYLHAQCAVCGRDTLGVLAHD